MCHIYGTGAAVGLMWVSINLAQKKTLIIDEVLDLSEIDLDTVKSLEKIAPFGMDNAKLASSEVRPASHG